MAKRSMLQAFIRMVRQLRERAHELIAAPSSDAIGAMR